MHVETSRLLPGREGFERQQRGALCVLNGKSLEGHFSSFAKEASFIHNNRFWLDRYLSNVHISLPTATLRSLGSGRRQISSGTVKLCSAGPDSCTLIRRNARKSAVFDASNLK